MNRQELKATLKSQADSLEEEIDKKIEYLESDNVFVEYEDKYNLLSEADDNLDDDDLSEAFGVEDDNDDDDYDEDNYAEDDVDNRRLAHDMTGNGHVSNKSLGDPRKVAKSAGNEMENSKERMMSRIAALRGIAIPDYLKNKK